MRWPYFRVEIAGETMVPTFLPGDRVLVRRHGRRLRPGDVVVYPDPAGETQWALGRVVDVSNRTRPTVAGDNPARGSASRRDVPVDRHCIEGRVVSVLSTVERPPRRSYR